MLKQRVITALLLAPILILLIYFLPNLYFNLLFALIIGFAAWEWSLLSKLSSTALRLMYVALTLIVMWLSYQFIPIIWALTIAAVWWVFALFLIFCYSQLNGRMDEKPWIKSFIGLMVLVPCWLGFAYLHGLKKGPDAVMFVLLIVWAMDSCAYFAGKMWGRHKLAKTVSPGKTYEGVLGGLVGTVFICLFASWMLHITPAKLLYVVLLAIVVAAMSVVGDLFESMLKRQANLKDSGSILPGHGGMLDRIDSLCAAVPIFALGAILLKLI